MAQSRQRTNIIILLVILTLASAIFRIWSSQPNWLHWDENYYINIAQNAANRGELTPYMWRLGQVNIITGGGSGYGIILLNFWLQFVNYSLFGGRLLMVAAGLSAAAVMGQVAHVWWKSRAAAIAAFIFGLVTTSSFFTMIVRMDAIGILCYALVLLLHISAVRLNKKWLHFAAGVAIVATFEFHVLGILYAAALLLYYFVCYIDDLRKKRRIIFNVPAVYFAGGAFIAGLIYYIVHILPDPNAYFFISRHCFECSVGISDTLPKLVLRFTLLRPQEAIILVAIITVAFIRRRREDIHIAILCVGWVGAYLVMGTPPYTHYTNHLWPLLAIGIGGLAIRKDNGKPIQSMLRVGLPIAIVILCVNLVMHIVGFHPFELAYQLADSAEIDYLTQNVAKDAVVVGSVANFWQLHDFQNYISFHDGEQYGLTLRGESYLGFWRRTKPTAIFLAQNVIQTNDGLVQYMKEVPFQQVEPNLWMAKPIQ